jgi:glyoxylase-like metal-dependent hydrolase (beta-lactamase superfamily II)
MRTGTIAMPRAYTYRGEWRRGRLDSPIGAFLLEHPDEGPVLVDTGWDPRVDVGRAMGLFFRGVRMDPADAVPARLDALGVEREAVRTVVMTHLHVDHTCAMAAFPGATFVTTRAEWAAAHARAAVLSGYVRAHLPAESSVRFVDFAGGEEVDLLGDGSIRLVSTPGHSLGHLSVLVESERGPVFLLGDAVYTLRNLREDILPLRTADDAASRETMRRLRAYADAHPDVPLIPTHDAAAWDAYDRT